MRIRYERGGNTIDIGEPTPLSMVTLSDSYKWWIIEKSPLINEKTNTIDYVSGSDKTDHVYTCHGIGIMSSSIDTPPMNFNLHLVLNTHVAYTP